MSDASSNIVDANAVLISAVIDEGHKEDVSPSIVDQSMLSGTPVANGPTLVAAEILFTAAEATEEINTSISTEDILDSVEVTTWRPRGRLNHGSAAAKVPADRSKSKSNSKDFKSNSSASNDQKSQPAISNATTQSNKKSDPKKSSPKK